MQDWISRYGSEIKGVIAENDDMGIGAIRALEEKGLAGKIPAGGVDAIKDGLREVKSGNMVATNLQNAAIELAWPCKQRLICWTTSRFLRRLC
jgi:ribose transport system substrate-binding protein